MSVSVDVFCLEHTYLSRKL